MHLSGASNDFKTICLPESSSKFSPLNDASIFPILNKVTPPPGTIPSSTAALVACNASSIRNFRSFNSASVAAPILIIATPPEIFPIRRCS